MIRQSLLHLPGIGPKRAIALQQAGMDDWRLILTQPPPAKMGAGTWARVMTAVERCEQALAFNDLHFLVKTIAKRDHWRILAEYFDQASYFDIETSGLDYDSYITTIACYHKGNLHTFVRGRNLDDFLDLLDEVKLLVSFCGSTFDVPRIESAFHIPRIPCPHIDLRWVCYYEQLAGGLKLIEERMSIHRPPDLQGVDGHEAVLLWHLWENQGDRRALETLVRYCSADTISLKLITARIVTGNGCSLPEMPDIDKELPFNSIAMVSQAGPEAFQNPVMGAANPGDAPDHESEQSGESFDSKAFRRLQQSRHQKRETYPGF